MADATPASTALRAEMASVCFSGLGKYGLPVFAVENLVLAICGRDSSGRLSLAFVRSCSKADLVPDSKAFACIVSWLWLQSDPR